MYKGLIFTAIWFALNAWWFVRVDAVSHSVSDTLIGVAPVFIVSTLLLVALQRRAAGETRPNNN